MFHLRALYSTWHNAGMVQVVNIRTSISWNQNTIRNSERMQRKRLVKLQTKVRLPHWQFVEHDINYSSGGDCPFGDECVYGHSCPNGTTCYYLKLGKCKFVAGEASRHHLHETTLIFASAGMHRQPNNWINVHFRFYYDKVSCFDHSRLSCRRWVRPRERLFVHLCMHSRLDIKVQFSRSSSRREINNVMLMEFFHWRTWARTSDSQRRARHTHFVRVT